MLNDQDEYTNNHYEANSPQKSSQQMSSSPEHHSSSNSSSYMKKNNWNFIPNLTRQDVAQQIANWPFIMEIFRKNSASDQVNLIECFMRIPSQADEPGFIYGFMDEKQNSVLEIPFWIKMGRTKIQVPQNRIFQWERDDQKLFTEIFTVRSLYNHKLQYLVHSLFAYARKRRQMTIMKNGVQKKVNRQEWFLFYEPTMTAAATNILNYLMDVIHEKYWKKNTESKFIKSRISESQDKKINNQTPNFYNKTLKHIDAEIEGTNKYLSELMKLSEQKKIEQIFQSIRTDLSIEIRDKQIKGKLSKIQDIDEGIYILNQDCDSVIGKQLKQIVIKMRYSSEYMKDIKTLFDYFESKVFRELKSLEENTAIHKKNVSSQQKQKKQKQAEKNVASKTKDEKSREKNKTEDKEEDEEICEISKQQFERRKIRENEKMMNMSKQQSSEKQQESICKEKSQEKQLDNLAKKFEKLKIYEDEDNDDDGQYYDCSGAQVQEKDIEDDHDDNDEQDYEVDDEQEQEEREQPNIDKYKREKPKMIEKSKADCITF